MSEKSNKDFSHTAVSDISVDLTAVLGTSDMKISNLLKIGRGAVIELDKNTDDTVDLQVESQLIARGEVIIVNENLAVSIREVFKKNRAIDE